MDIEKKKQTTVRMSKRTVDQLLTLKRITGETQTDIILRAIDVLHTLETGTGRDYRKVKSEISEKAELRNQARALLWESWHEQK